MCHGIELPEISEAMIDCLDAVEQEDDEAMPLPAKDLHEKLYEQGLPDYLQHDLDAYKEGLRTHSSLLDCLWGELYGSINMAEISDGCISPEHADYLRKKFLWGNPFAEDENSSDQSETEIAQIL